MCVLVADPNTKERYVVSITHLIIDPNHSLASEVQAYQRQRTRKLMLQNQAGFASEMLAEKPAERRKRGWGFGK